MAWAGWKFCGCFYLALVNFGVPLRVSSVIAMVPYIAFDYFACQDEAHWTLLAHLFIALEALTALAALAGDLNVGGMINVLYCLAGGVLFITGEAPVITPGVDFLGDKFAMAWVRTAHRRPPHLSSTPLKRHPPLLTLRPCVCVCVRVCACVCFPPETGGLEVLRLLLLRARQPRPRRRPRHLRRNGALLRLRRLRRHGQRALDAARVEFRRARWRRRGARSHGIHGKVRGEGATEGKVMCRGMCDVSGLIHVCTAVALYIPPKVSESVVCVSRCTCVFPQDFLRVSFL